MIQTDRSTSFHDYRYSSKRLEIIHLRENFPELTLREIGEKVNLTRERVRQILIDANLNTKSLARMTSPLPLCATCNKTLHNRRLKCCSQECQYPNGQTTFQCATRGTSQTVMTSVYKARMQRNSTIHCSRTCRDHARRKANG